MAFFKYQPENDKLQQFLGQKPIDINKKIEIAFKSTATDPILMLILCFSYFTTTVLYKFLMKSGHFGHSGEGRGKA